MIDDEAEAVGAAQEGEGGANPPAAGVPAAGGEPILKMPTALGAAIAKLGGSVAEVFVPWQDNFHAGLDPLPVPDDLSVADEAIAGLPTHREFARLALALVDHAPLPRPRDGCPPEELREYAEEMWAYELAVSHLLVKITAAKDAAKRRLQQRRAGRPKHPRREAKA